MKVVNKHKISLGLETFNALGFNSEEELNKEILKLTKVRSEFENKLKVNSI